MTSQKKKSSFGAQLAPRLLLASALGLSIAVVSHADQQQPVAAASGDNARMLPSPPPLAQSAYSVGDTLKISFFAQLDLPGDTGASGSIAVKTFYQRLDLTGTYVIDNDGTIDIPRLGRIAFADRDSDSVKTDLVSAYEDEIGTAGDVHLAVLERQPIYVVGPVRTPGQYKFVSGMVAIKAIALAGGMARPNDVVGTVLETERASATSAEARTRLSTLIARKARLEAEQSGALMLVPSEIVDLVGSAMADQIIAAERQARDKADRARAANIEMYEDLAARASSDLAEVNRDIARVTSEIDSRQRQLMQVAEPDPRLTNHVLEASLRSEIVSLKGQMDAYKREARQLSQRALESRNASNKLELDHDAQVSKELVKVNDEIARTLQQALSGDTLSTSISRQARSGDLDTMTITIVRSTPEGPVTFPASSTTTLAPGDVVQLAFSNYPAGSVSQLTESLGQ